MAILDQPINEWYMLKINLSKIEYTYLSQASFLPKKVKTMLPPKDQAADGCMLTVSEEQADEIRDLCGERLQIAGFDKDYALTQEGEILEDLIDKFFTA